MTLLDAGCFCYGVANGYWCYVGRKPAKVSRLGADPTWKAMWRLIRSNICHYHKVYYTVTICWAVLVYQFWWHTCVGYYRQRNYHRSLEYAQKREAEWELNKPKEDEYGEEDDSEEEAPAEGAEAEAAEDEE
jgi:hypothetical protein